MITPLIERATAAIDQAGALLGRVDRGLRSPRRVESARRLLGRAEADAAYGNYHWAISKARRVQEILSR